MQNGRGGATITFKTFDSRVRTADSFNMSEWSRMHGRWVIARTRQNVPGQAAETGQWLSRLMLRSGG